MWCGRVQRVVWLHLPRSGRERGHGGARAADKTCVAQRWARETETVRMSVLLAIGGAGVFRRASQREARVWLGAGGSRNGFGKTTGTTLLKAIVARTLLN